MTQPRPPLPWFLAYRFLGLRLPDEHREWVVEDVAGKHFVSWRIGRALVWSGAAIGAYYLVQSTVHLPPARNTMYRLFLGALAIGLLASRNSLVRRTLRWHRIDRHGRPVPPKRLAMLDNREAVVLGAATVVAVVAGMAAWSHGLRPSGGSCRKPDAATLQVIRAGLKDQATEIRTPQALPFGREGLRSTMVAAYVKKAGADEPALALWIVTRDSTVYELRGGPQAAQSATTFEPPPPTVIDRNGIVAVQTLVTCLNARANR